MKAETRTKILEEEKSKDEKVVESWNSMVTSLLEARKIWEEQIRGTPREIIDNSEPMLTKMLSVYRLADFNIMLARFIDYWRGAGGLSTMIIKRR